MKSYNRVIRYNKKFWWLKISHVFKYRLPTYNKVLIRSKLRSRQVRSGPFGKTDMEKYKIMLRDELAKSDYSRDVDKCTEVMQVIYKK